MFLGELEEVLELTDMAEFQKCMVPLFRKIASCLNSSHFQVRFTLYILFWSCAHNSCLGKKILTGIYARVIISFSNKG